MVTVGQTGHTEIVFASSLSAGDGVSTDHLQLFENFEQLLLMIGGGAASLVPEAAIDRCPEQYS
jgi:hypothetical protein